MQITIDQTHIDIQKQILIMNHQLNAIKQSKHKLYNYFKDKQCQRQIIQNKLLDLQQRKHFLLRQNKKKLNQLKQLNKNNKQKLHDIKQYQQMNQKDKSIKLSIKQSLCLNKFKISQANLNYSNLIAQMHTINQNIGISQKLKLILLPLNNLNNNKINQQLSSAFIYNQSLISTFNQRKDFTLKLKKNMEQKKNELRQSQATHTLLLEQLKLCQQKLISHQKPPIQQSQKQLQCLFKYEQNLNIQLKAKHQVYQHILNDLKDKESQSLQIIKNTSNIKEEIIKGRRDQKQEIRRLVKYKLEIQYVRGKLNKQHLGNA